MADTQRRDLERAAARGDDEAALRLLGDHLRTGSELPRERLELAAYLLQPRGPDLLGLPLSGLPSSRFQKGTRIELGTPRPGQLRFQLTCLDPRCDAARLGVTGYLGSRSSPWYEDAFREVSQLGLRRLLLDLRHCGGVNSGGIGSLIRLSEDLRLRDGVLAILLQQPLRMVVDMLGLNTFLSLAASESEGLRLVLEGSATSQHHDPDTWLQRLLRWGPELAAQGALAVARGLRGSEPADTRVGQALEAAEAWLRDPGEARAEEALLASESARSLVRLQGPALAVGGWWAIRAAHLAGAGIWPEGAPEALPAQRALLKQTLLGLALGYAQPSVT